MHRQRNTSSRSRPVTPSLINWTTFSTNIFVSKFSAAVTFSGEGVWTIKSEVGKASRLTWSWDVLAVEPGRLPTSNQFRESHSRERTPMPLLDTQTTHLDDMGLRVTCFRFLHRLGTDGEDMFEKTLVRSTPQKVFTHRHECGKVRDGIGRKMVELVTQEVQEAPEEGMRRERKNPVDMGGEQYTLAMTTRGSASCLSPPLSPSSHAPASPSCPSPWRQSGTVEGRRTRCGGEAEEEERETSMHSADASAPLPYKGLLPSGLRVGPGDPVKSRNSHVLCTWRKRWCRNRGTVVYPPRLLRRAPSRALPRNFVSCEIRDTLQSIAPKILHHQDSTRRMVQQVQSTAL